MGENAFFRKALANFTYETASAGAIRHLADQGYTVEQIVRQLDYPTPYEKVRATVWEHLIETDVIKLEEPGSSGGRQKAVYVREYDRFGKSTFRRVPGAVEEETVIQWQVHSVGEPGDCGTESLLSLLREKIAENGEARSYASFDFGLTAKGNPSRYQEILALLDERQREYVDGLPWENRRVYHRLDLRMTEILIRLYGAGQYRGECCFLKTGEKFLIPVCNMPACRPRPDTPGPD